MPVALGGALGACARYAVGLWATRVLGTSYPWGTLLVNVAGSLLIGLALPLLARHDAARLLFVTGFLGAFTTFSTFSADTLTLLQSGRTGTALGYAAGSVAAGLAAAALGAGLARVVLRVL